MVTAEIVSTETREEMATIEKRARSVEKMTDSIQTIARTATIRPTWAQTPAGATTAFQAKADRINHTPTAGNLLIRLRTIKLRNRAVRLC